MRRSLTWNERLDRLEGFPFRRLARLLEGTAPGGPGPVRDLSIGEPRHAPPPLLAEAVAAHAHLWNRYPPLAGTPEYREAACSWLARRFGLPSGALDPDRHLLPLAGTKEGLFLLPQLAVPRPGAGPPAVLLPNPVYPTYLGAAIMAGAEPVPLPATAATGHLPDLEAIPRALLDRCALLFLCSPANPQGAVAGLPYLRRAVRLARAHGFLLAVDECYSELWDREAPPGGLEAAWAEDKSFDHVLVLHSLSKRSNAAGLRVGFVAGDAGAVARFARLRAYGAAVPPLPLLAAGAALWADEAHVEANRALYRAKFDAAERRLAGRLGFARPPAGFFLWLDVAETGQGGEAAALRLWAEAGVKALPGGYLAAPDPATGGNPAATRLRLALVDGEGAVDDALARVARTLTPRAGAPAAAAA